jgi:hypothetical protein
VPSIVAQPTATILPSGITSVLLNWLDVLPGIVVVRKPVPAAKVGASLTGATSITTLPVDPEV